MLVYDTELGKKLEALGLPVYYEQIVDSTVSQPCITYKPASNIDYMSGMNDDTNNLLYSHIDYYVKVWGQQKKELTPYVEQVAELMRKLGFRRSSYTELATDTGVCLVGLYKATGFEHY